jgi:hypothetical protein
VPDLIGVILFLLVIVILIVVGGIVLLAFTTGFKHSGRLMGGLYAVIAPQGNGKTYIVTMWALEAMEKGRKVFSNFPIVSVDGKYVSRVWKKEYQDENLTGAMIIIDEAYRDYFSRDFKHFSKDDALFFSTLGQREISLYFVSQHEDRVDTAINDAANLFITVSKVEVPFIQVPLYFDVVFWVSERDMQNSPYHPDIEPYDTQRYWFSLDVAGAYDTKWFAKDARKRFEGIDWVTYNKSMNPPKLWSPPERVSLLRRIFRKLNGVALKCLITLKKLRQIRTMMVWIMWKLYVMWIFSSLRRKLQMVFPSWEGVLTGHLMKVMINE